MTSHWLELFPLSEVGVAQGSLLSVLVANLSLRHFDACLNVRPLTTIRYRDDFAIFVPDLAAVSAGFEVAREELAKLGMTCYEPADGSQKGFLGLVANGFDFLRCRIHPDGVSPGRGARRASARDRVDHTRGQTPHPRVPRSSVAPHVGGDVAQTLVRIDKKVRGAGSVPFRQ